MKNRILMTAIGLAAELPLAAEPQAQPNLVFILADDLGYGDIHALNPERCKIDTPNMDRLRAEGLAFTDCHSSSAVCTPSRYSILTGRYCWRTRLQKGVLYGDSEPLIASDRLTVGGLLQRHGYTTAALGKWHLGLQFDKQDFTQPITDGPLQHGFDYFFGIAASLDMPPYVFIENDHFMEIPSVNKRFPMYGEGARPGLSRPGLAALDFEATDVLPKLTAKATDYIGARGADRRPFFLYLSLPSPHTPLVPSKEWQGKSGMGSYGDYVMETDWAVGEVLQVIDQAGLGSNTLVMLTSDNGFAPYVGADALEAIGHYPSAQFRGYKADILEGGHRIPFLVRWSGTIKAGSQSDRIICLSDLMATCADFVGVKLADNTAEDSISFLPVLYGQPVERGREDIVHHSFTGRFAIRRGEWKQTLAPGSGGWSSPTDAEAVEQGLPKVQLYNMAKDVGERENLEAQYPEKVKELTRLLEDYVTWGRSTPGAVQKNDAEIDLVKKQ